MKLEDIVSGKEYIFLGQYVTVRGILTGDIVMIETRFGEKTECHVDELTPKPPRPTKDAQTTRPSLPRVELEVDDLRALRFDNCYGNNFFCHEFIKGSFKIIEPSEFNAFRTFIYYRDGLPVAFIRTKQEFDELIGKLTSLDRPVRAKA